MVPSVERGLGLQLKVFQCLLSLPCPAGDYEKFLSQFKALPKEAAASAAEPASSSGKA